MRIIWNLKDKYTFLIKQRISPTKICRFFRAKTCSAFTFGSVDQFLIRRMWKLKIMFLQAFENSLVHLRKRNMWSQLTDQNVQSLNKMSQVRETGGGGVGERHSAYCPVWRYIMSHNTQISPKRVRFQGCESSTVHSFILNRLKPNVWYRASDRPLDGLLNASEAYLLDQLF